MIYVVDNGSIHVDEIVALAGQYAEITIVPITELSADSIPLGAIVVLSGGPLDVYDHRSRYQSEIDLIKQHQGPLVGICLGLELIVCAFGGELQKMPTYHKDVVDIPITKSNEDLGLQEGESLRAYKSHGWVVTAPPDNFESLLESDTGIDIMRHKTRPIWGFQFHPEVLQDGSNAHNVLNALLEKITLANTIKM